MQGEQDLAHSQGGLGLSLVQQIMALYGGDVAAYSAGIGKGSEFVVRLPPIEAPVPTTDPERETPVPRARSVLVVDDNRDAADTMAALLDRLGYRASTAYDGATALAEVRASQPDFAFLDIGLPDTGVRWRNRFAPSSVRGSA